MILNSLILKFVWVFLYNKGFEIPLFGYLIWICILSFKSIEEEVERRNRPRKKEEEAREKGVKKKEETRERKKEKKKKELAMALSLSETSLAIRSH